MVVTSGRNGYLDPLNSAQYTLDCGDASESLIIGFTSFTGPKLVREALTYFPGGTTSAFERKIPSGKVTCEPIEINKAVIPFDQMDNLRNWYNQCVDVSANGRGFQSMNFRRPVRIMAKSNDNVVQRVITLYEAWPSDMKVLSDFDGSSPAVVIETLTIQWEGLRFGTAGDLPALPFSFNL